MCFNTSTGLYSCQLDEQWFNLHKDLLKDALDVTPTNDNNPFVALPSSDIVIEYVNTLGYPNTLKNVSAIFVGKEGRKIFGMSIPDALFTDEIKGALYYGKYQEHVAKCQQYLDAEHGKAEEGGAIESPKATKVSKLKAAKATKPAAKRSKGGLVSKIQKPKSSLKLVDEPSDEDVLVEEPAYNEEEANFQRALELSLRKSKTNSWASSSSDSKEQEPCRSIYLSKPTEASRHAESPSLDAEPTLTDSETESDNVGSTINTGAQDEGQAGPNLGNQDEGQSGPNPGNQDEGQAGLNPGEQDEGQAGSNPGDENLKLPNEGQVIPKEPTSSTRTLSSLQNIDKELSFTNQFFMEKPHEEEPKKINVESEVQSIVLVPIRQDTSSVPLMTTLVIDLTTSQTGSPPPTSTGTTSTTLQPPPQPQQSTSNSILLHRIGERQLHMANLIQNNLALEERLDKQGSRLYNLENLNIHHQVGNAVDEIVTDAVDWAMQAPLRARFRDLPTIDMKEILQQWMFKDDSCKAHEEEARKKKRKKHAAPRTPFGSPPSTPPPPPPLAGSSSAPDTSGASGSSQLPPPRHPPPSIGSSRSAQLHGSEAPSLSKTVASAHQSMTWTTYDTRYELASKPLPGEETPATPEPAWTIPTSNMSDLDNNWVSTMVSTYEHLAKNSLLAMTGDMMTFMNWYCRQVNKTELTLADFEGHAYEAVKAFYPDTNPEGDQVRVDVNQPLPLGGPLSHVTIQTQFFFNKDLEYLDMAKFYIDIHDYLSRRKEVRSLMRILNVVRIKAYSRYEYDYLSEIVFRRVDFEEHTVAEKYFKNLYPSYFEDLNLLLLQCHLNHLPGLDKRMLSTAVKL
nr:hypothetical protein [Tanacetum cinerariifolium]